MLSDLPPDGASRFSTAPPADLGVRVLSSSLAFRFPMSVPDAVVSLTAPDAVVVLTTVATSASAVTLVRALLDRRLVACGTMLPAARSLYRWEDRVADESEVVVLLKTRRDRLKEIEVAFAELHPYTLPELLALDVAYGIDRYLGWIAAETAAGVAE